MYMQCTCTVLYSSVCICTVLYVPVLFYMYRYCSICTDIVLYIPVLVCMYWYCSILYLYCSLCTYTVQHIYTWLLMAASSCSFLPQAVTGFHHIFLKFQNIPRAFIFQISRQRTCFALDGMEIDGMCTQCTLYTAYLYYFLFCFYQYNVHIKQCMLIYFTNLFYRYEYNKKGLTHVEIQEQTASLPIP